MSNATNLQETANHQAQSTNEPLVTVGIMSDYEIHFMLNSIYHADQKTISGKQTVTFSNGKIAWQGQLYDELLFEPKESNASFSLYDVVIGVHFHWERKETQTFLGALKLVIDSHKIYAMNVLPIENYLESVISSEMKATSSLQLLKAHAVISRSWLLAQINKSKELAHCQHQTPSFTLTDNELIRWYDREDHTFFDVCADDHCQRYQGITKETSPYVKTAVNETRGQILMYDGKICDARFSKSCGGVTEQFEFCWEETYKPYLRAMRDLKQSSEEELPIGDLTIETNAEKWIRTTPDSFCNTHNKNILSQVLNDYDQETTDFYRWQVTYTQAKLQALITKKLGIDFGTILDLVPIERGKSGRLTKLKIVGSLKTLTIGKELEIRRALSESHLYSSAFVVDKENIVNNVPQSFVITGAGWGHGVGLCQIGAAVMGEKGYPYNEILALYYPDSILETTY